jgi:hypothetical protein
MALQFTPTGCVVSQRVDGNLSVVITFNLADSVSPTNILGSPSVETVTASNRSLAQIQNDILSSCVSGLQSWYNSYKLSLSVSNSYTSNVTALGTYINAHVTF